MDFPADPKSIAIPINHPRLESLTWLEIVHTGRNVNDCQATSNLSDVDSVKGAPKYRPKASPARTQMWREYFQAYFPNVERFICK